MLDDFLTDHLEKVFGKLRQSAGASYFKFDQQAIEKMHNLPCQVAFEV